MAASIKAGLNNDMHLMTDGVTRAYIDSDGNMGIGTTNPDTNSKLHVATGVGTFVARDENGYTRATANNGSAQIGLFRAGSSAGGMYIGADADAFRLYNSSFAQRMNVTQDGQMTAPSQPSFKAQLSAQFNTPASITKVTGWSTANTTSNLGMHNVGGHLANDRFTAPVAGRYFFMYTGLHNVGSASSTSYTRASFTINGATAHDGLGDYGAAGVYVRHMTSGIFQLNANDYVEVTCDGAGGTGYIYTTYTNWSGYLLG